MTIKLAGCSGLVSVLERHILEDGCHHTVVWQMYSRKLTSVFYTVKILVWRAHQIGCASNVSIRTPKRVC